MAVLASGTASPKKIYASRRVLDCGGQYCHLIASRVRRHEALSVIVPCDAPVSTFADAGAIIVSGGPQSVFDPASMRVDKALWDLPVPILGICYGCQMMCQDLGGKVEQAAVGEYGPATLEVVKAGGVMPGDADKTTVWMSHRDKVVALPPGFETTGKTAACANAAVQCCDGTRRLYGLQLHQVTHSAKGEAMLGAFVELSGLKGTWKMDDFVDQQIAAIRAKCGASRNVFVLVSGGVDSTVTYALLAKALPAERILGLYVDTGMMRKGESELFLKALEGLTAPEAKRRVIGQQFLEIQRAQAKAYGLDPSKWLLGQGTIYPDTIESGGSAKKADVIKTHHNRVPEIDALIEQGLVIEPLADLYKDEVRAVGERLGLASHLVWRQPFPGPGLGVRLLCHDGAPEPVDDGDSRTYRNFAILAGAYERDWDALGAISTELVNESKLVNRVVAGEEVIILRPVDSTEAMTAAFSKVPFALCDKIAAAIKAKLPRSPTSHDVTNKPPGTIEWE
ncbi:GMP synthase [Aureococcus anophagefferens]|nr:GMP synthase [Aureococcus anophagefferens]